MGILLATPLMVGCKIDLPDIPEENQVFEEEIKFINEDGIVLAGRFIHCRADDLAAVLAHSGVLGEDQTGLHPLARSLAEKEIVIFPGANHSMELFRSEHGDEMHNLVFEFFEGIQ